LRLEKWTLYSSSAVLQNLNAHKELQPNYKTYCRKLHAATKEKVILISCFAIYVRHFTKFLKNKNVVKI